MKVFFSILVSFDVQISRSIVHENMIVIITWKIFTKNDMIQKKLFEFFSIEFYPYHQNTLFEYKFGVDSKRYAPLF